MSFAAISIAGVGIGLAGSIGKMIGNSKANKGLGKLLASDPNYATSAAGIANQKLASGRVGYAQTLLNSRMPGSATIDRNIYGAGAGARAAVSRNATDSAQAALLDSGVQGQESDAFTKSGLNQGDYQKWAVGNFNNAQQGMADENRYAFGDQTRRFEDQAQIQGAQNANSQNTWGSISNAGFGLANFGMNGGFSGLAGNGKTPAKITTGVPMMGTNTGYPNAGGLPPMNMPSYNGG